jgi:hypothetical protein
MSRSYLAALILTAVSCSLVFGQQPQTLSGDYWSAPQNLSFDGVIRGQSPEVVQVDYRSNSELMEHARYRSLLEEFEQTQAELARLQRNLNAAGIEDHTDHFSLASFNMNNTRYQPEGGGMNGGGADGGGGGDVATQSQNPVGGLWMMWLQNDMKLLEGPAGGKRIFNTTVFQPVLPIQLTEEWRVINRPIFTFNAFEVPDLFQFRPGGNQDPVFPPTDPFSTQAGLGDTMLIQWLSNSPADSKTVTGYGWNWMFPTATNQEELGTGRTSVGPSVVAMYLGDKVITGGIMQQYFSIDNRGSRDRVSLMDLQYIFRYRLNPTFSVGFSPNIQWDQVTEKVTVPVGLGFDVLTMTKKKTPIRWGAELQYFASHESGNRPFDPEWNFRLYVSPIIKAPEWATRGLFGGCSCNRCNRCR